MVVSELIDLLRRFPTNGEVWGYEELIVDTRPYSKDGCSSLLAGCPDSELPDILREACEREQQK